MSYFKNVIVILIFIIFGCEFSNDKYKNVPIFKIKYDHSKQVNYMLGNCQHQAIFTASVAASYGFEYEAIVGWVTNNTTNKTGKHVHVRVLNNDIWHWAYMKNAQRVELYENFGDWNKNNTVTFVINPHIDPMNLEELANKIEFEWWDGLRVK